jgi:hypothetical protein
MDASGDILDLTELQTLRTDNPQGLFKHLSEVQRSFLFGVEDHRDEASRWGGEVRVILNRNIELHFVPGFNEAMSAKGELPQFCVFPDEARADTVEDTSLLLEEEGEEIKGAIFYVDPTEYDVMVGAATEVVERYATWDLIPDTYFLDTPLIQFIERVVLEHTAIKAEREYDFRRGLVGGAPPDAEALEDEPVPVIGEEEEDEGYTAHPDLLLGADEGEPSDDELDEDEDGDDEEDDEGGRPKHFRSIPL